jgi:hypothetical protein
MLLKPFPRRGFFTVGNKSKSGGLVPKIEETTPWETLQKHRRINNEGVQTGIQDFPKRWTTVIKHNGDYIEGL